MSGPPPPPPPPAGGPPFHGMYGGPPPGWPPAAGMQPQPPMQYPPPPPVAAAPASVPEKKPKKEKPKKKDPIPGAPGWLRVTTNMGNVFYTHTETKRSEWTIPDEIKDAVAELEAQERAASQSAAAKEAAASAIISAPVSAAEADAAADAAEAEAADAVQAAVSTSDGKRKRQEEAEEQETPTQRVAQPALASAGGEIDAADLIGQPPAEDGEDDSDADSDANDDATQPMTKRPRTDSHEQEGDAEQDEDDDMAWQLQAAAEMAAEAEAADTDQPRDQAAAPAPSAPPPGAPPSAPAAFQPPPPPPGGYTGPPPGFPPAPVPAPAASPPRPAMSLEEGRALFLRMLTSLNGTRDEINPMAPWDRELTKIVHRPEYTALANLRDRQDAFNDWCRDRLREKRKQRAAGGGGSAGVAGPSSPSTSTSSSKATATTTATEGSGSGSKSSDAAQAYRKLLEDNVKSTRTRFDDFRKEFKKDRRFFGFGRDDKEREKHFKVYLRDLGEQKRKAAEAAEADFVSLLDSTAGGARRENEAKWKGMTDEELKNEAWRNVKKMGDMETRREYDAVGSSSRRAELFVQWARGKVGGTSGGAASSPATSAPASAAGAARAGSADLDAESAAKRRRERALQEREEQVRRQRAEAERKNRRALGEATRGDSALRFGELLVDAVRDPLTSWGEACRELGDDARFQAPGMGAAQKREMFEQHVAKLVERKRAQLRALFEKYAPRLDTEREVVLPQVKNDADYERLRMRSFVVGLRRRAEAGRGDDGDRDGDEYEEDEALEAEWKVWQRHRENRAKDDFQQMLKENSFVDFWGRLRAEAQRKSNSNAEQDPIPLDQPGARAHPDRALAPALGGEVQVHTGENNDEEARTRRLLRAQQLGPRAGAAAAGVGDDEDFAPGPGEEEEDEEENADLVRMSAQVDLEEIHAVLRNDARYRAWGHKRELREEWIREYLRGLGGRTRTVFQQKQ